MEKINRSRKTSQRDNHAIRQAVMRYFTTSLNTCQFAKKIIVLARFHVV